MKTIKTLSIILVCSFTLSLIPPAPLPFIEHTYFCSTVYAASSDDAPPEIHPTSSTFVWKYKIQNGIMYKRKYNQIRKQWIGDWIKA